MSDREPYDNDPYDCRPICRGHGHRIEGASFNGRCLQHHEESLAPVPADGLADTGEQWSDIYLGGPDE